MSLRINFTKLRDTLRASLWFWPALTALAAFGLAKGLVIVDGHISPERDAWFLFSGESESARELVSTIASSMMTFTGLVFSITILVLQLASGQFSPRVMRTFLEDRYTHGAMASFVGSFVYAMALLPHIHSPTEHTRGFVPALSVFVGFVLVLVSVAVFIKYIDHMAHAVRAVTILKRVGTETRRSLERMYPQDLLQEAEPEVTPPSSGDARVVSHHGRAGVVSAVDESLLVGLARQYDGVIGLVPMPGDFVPRGAPLFQLWGGCREADEQALHDAVFFAEERTPHQDPAFGFRQLVDIAERALSPGINDPSTAVQALDEIHDLLRTLAQRGFPSPLRVDEAGRLRLILPRMDWEGYVRLGLDEIRQYGGRSIQVLRRMRALVEDCLSIAPPRRRPPLVAQLDLLDQTAEQKMDLPDDQRRARQPSIQGQGEH